MSTQPASLGVPLEKLADFLGLTPRRVRQLLDDGHVVRAADGKDFEFLPSVKAYIAYLQQAAQGKAVSDDGKDKQKAQTELLKIQRDRAQIELDKSRGVLVPIDDVRASTIKLLKVLSEGVDSLPDLLERKTGVTGAIVEATSEVCHHWRMRLYENAVEMMGGEVLPDDATVAAREVPADSTEKVPMLLNKEPEPTTNKKRGRPRKVKADSFTPELL